MRNIKFQNTMGNSFIFSAPKCSYTNATLEPFFHPVPVVENYYSNKPGFTTVVRRNIPTLYIKSSAKSKYLMIYFHGNAEDLGSTCPQLLQYYEHFQVFDRYLLTFKFLNFVDRYPCS